MGISNDQDRRNILYKTVKNGNEKESFSKDQVPTIGIRHGQALLFFLIIFTGFGFRVTFSMSVVSMTNPNASINPDVPTYTWTDRSVILSAFFWGYILPQTFAGYAANRFGAKWFLIVTTSLQCVLMILVPWLADNLGSKSMWMVRAIQGFCQGFLIPSCAHLISQWVPHEERSRLGGFVYGAAIFGTVVSIFITGIISASWYGWPMVFYGYGGFGVICCILFSIFGYNSPAVHPSISFAEKYYIESSLGHTDEKPSHKVPWKSILTSVPLWTLFIVQCGNNYCFWTLLTQIPTYMNTVMNFSMKDNSMLSALPYLTYWILSFAFTFLSDFIINKKFVSRSNSRKLFNTIGLAIPAISLIYLGFTKADQTLQAVVLLTTAVGFNAACLCGWGINHLDLSPNHAGTLMGLTNGFSNIPGILAPLIVQVVVKDESDPLQWRIIFFCAASLNLIVSLIYIIFGTAEVQPWNEDQEDKKTKTLS